MADEDSGTNCSEFHRAMRAVSVNLHCWNQEENEAFTFSLELSVLRIWFSPCFSSATNIVLSGCFATLKTTEETSAV